MLNSKLKFSSNTCSTHFLLHLSLSFQALLQVSCICRYNDLKTQQIERLGFVVPE